MLGFLVFETNSLHQFLTLFLFTAQGCLLIIILEKIFVEAAFAGNRVTPGLTS